MPLTPKRKKIESCVKQLMAKGYSQSKAYAICTAAQNSKGKAGKKGKP